MCIGERLHIRDIKSAFIKTNKQKKKPDSEDCSDCQTLPVGRENKPCAVVAFSRSCYTFVHGEMNLSRKYQVIIKLFNKYFEEVAKSYRVIFGGDKNKEMMLVH